jgi:hypothetical protein
VTVTNAGTIIGTKDALIFDSGTASRLTVDPNAVVGTLTGLNLVNAVTLDSRRPARCRSSQFIGFSRISVDVGSLWTLAGPNTLPMDATLTTAGTLTPLDATPTVDAVVNNGGIVLDPSTMAVASLTGTV